MGMMDPETPPRCKCGEIIPPWRRAWSKACDACGILVPMEHLRGSDPRMPDRFEQ
jgi:hypothetical protein